MRWLGRSTETIIRQLAARGQKQVLVVPIAFTSDHIETLSEIDIAYSELAYALGMTGFRRVPSLNARTEFLDALADIVHGHLESGKPHSTQYKQRCPGCTNDACRGPPSKMSAPVACDVPAEIAAMR
ncbi:ferrochelatase [Gemmatimonas sp.]|uniref:ferrochelatase n=1 Tax=Gemmatimonas sp. TaxID=1962908 RepID=UPI0037C0BFA9